MSTATPTQDFGAVNVDGRVSACDWPATAQHLDAHGWALFPKLSQPARCRDCHPLRRRPSVPQPHRHGAAWLRRGEYKYFTYPLPGHGRCPALDALSAPGSHREPMERIDGHPCSLPGCARGLHCAVPRGGADATDAACCCSMARATSTRCTRISTASTCFHCRSPSCSRSQTRTSRAASSY